MLVISKSNKLECKNNHLTDTLKSSDGMIIGLLCKHIEVQFFMS